MTGALKKFDAHNLDIQNINLRLKKIEHVFNVDKYNCLFLIYTKQLSPSNCMTVKKKHISKAEQGFLDGVYTEV